jgi:hypothetical protein
MTGCYVVMTALAAETAEYHCRGRLAPVLEGELGWLAMAAAHAMQLPCIPDCNKIDIDWMIGINSKLNENKINVLLCFCDGGLAVFRFTRTERLVPGSISGGKYFHFFGGVLAGRSINRPERNQQTLAGRGGRS